MWVYGITVAGDPFIEFVPTQQAVKTKFRRLGGTAGTEERAKLLLRKLLKEEQKDVVHHNSRVSN